MCAGTRSIWLQTCKILPLKHAWYLHTKGRRWLHDCKAIPFCPLATAQVVDMLSEGSSLSHRGIVLSFTGLSSSDQNASPLLSLCKPKIY